ncbi:MAG: hypothetical protein ACFFG0_34250 [Candidatus Thorarchaeota archaeon]
MAIGKPQECSQCGNLCQDVRCFINKNTGEIWCEYCIGKEKRKRNINDWGNFNKRWHQKY